MNIDGKKLLKIGEKHQKLFESTNINPYAYYINSIPYYFVFYKNKWTGTEKGFAIITPEKGDKNDTDYAFTAHINYGITANNIRDGRSRLDINTKLFHQDVKEYLENILNQEELDSENKTIYKRTYELLVNIEELQKKFVDLWEEAKKLIDNVDDKGYFTDDEMEKLIQYMPTFNLIQYKQLQPRYNNRRDFDYIYNNRNKIIQPNSTKLNKLLAEMTSDSASAHLQGSLDLLTRNIVVSNQESYDELHRKWDVFYRRDLQDRIEKEIQLLRYP